MTSPHTLPEDHFQHLLESLDAGADRQAISARLAAAPPEIRALVELTQQLRSAATPPPDAGPALARTRQRILASLPSPAPVTETVPLAAGAPILAAAARRPAQARPRPASPGWWERLQGAFRLSPAPAWAAVVAVLLLFLGLTAFTTVRVSAAALPGQPLYSVKRASENITLLLTRDPKAREQLLQDFDDRRRTEANALFDRGLEEKVEVTGELIGREPQGWRVSEWLVVGNDDAFVGLPLGAVVRIGGVTMADGRIRADSVLIIRRPTPSPTPTPAPSATPTAHAKATRRPAPNVAPTATEEPTRRHRPTRTPLPTPTVLPSASPTSTPGIIVYIGAFRGQNGGLITVDSETFRLAPTVNVTGIKIGSLVRVYYRLLAGGDKLVFAIDLIAAPETTPRPPFTVTDEITSLEGDRITVGGLSFRITAQTDIDGDLAVGKQASVSGHYDADDELIADSIVVRELPSIAFRGVIVAIQGSRLTLSSSGFGSFVVDIGQANVAGVPVIGAEADGEGRQRPDGVIIATSISITPPTATPTPPPTPAEPTPTDTPLPATDTPAPTDTPPPPTDTPAPTNTPVPPTHTPLPPTEPPSTSEPTEEAE